MTTTPSGWYDDGHGTMRWWDGAQWTEQVAAPTSAVTGTAVTETAVPREAEQARMYPGAAEAPAGTPGLPPEPTKSKLWIVWVVLGVVVLGMVIAAAVLIPRIFGAFGDGRQSGGVTPANPDQQAALAAVELYDDAWQNADCDAYLASTTEEFRTQSGLTDCSAFETEAEVFSAAIEDYEVAVTNIEGEGEQILISTTETYTLLLNEDGTPLDEPTDESIDWVYVVVPDGDDWGIDELQ